MERGKRSEEEERRRGAARKAAAAAQPAPSEKAAKPAAAPAKGRGRGRREPPSPEGPAKAPTALRNAGQGSQPRGAARGTSRENGSPGAETPGRPAGGTCRKPPTAAAAAKGDEKEEDHRGAVQKKPLPAKAEEAASGAVSRGGESRGGRSRREEPDGRGKKAPPEEEAEGPGRAEAGPRGPPPPSPPVRSSALRPVLQRLKLRQAEVEVAALRVNFVADRLAAALTKWLYSDEKVERVNVGSYYEGLKISKPDEFDIMLKVPEVRVELEPYNEGDFKGAFCFAKLQRNKGLQRLNDFVDDQQHLSASKFLSALRSMIIEEVKNIDGMRITLERKKSGSPAITLLIERPRSHISVDIILALEMRSKTVGSILKGRPDIKSWLGEHQKKELDRKQLWLVPKNAKDGAGFKDTWRLSFSLPEKTIIQYHGNKKTCCKDGSKCCRKDCVKLLKYLLEQLKTKHKNRNQFSKFCSYHAKTAFFHACTRWTSDEEWRPENLGECFERFLDYFLDCLKKAELKHFFIPECNLFCTDAKCSLLAKVIENERTNGFPVFQQT